MKLSLSFSQRIVLWVSLLIIGLLITAGAGGLLTQVSDNQVANIRITMVCQCLVAFVIPAVVVALLITRLPAQFLMIKSAPQGTGLILSIITLMVSFPAIEWINSLCASLPWPQQILNLEHEAEQQTLLMLGEHNVPNLILSILIMGVMTGLAEELFFRGAFMRILQTRPMSMHAAVWISAIVFSLIHFQMVGFVPRALLGAMFGYAALWTGSLWTAVLLHMINNTCAILTIWFGINMISNPFVGVVSVLLAIGGMCLIKRSSKNVLG